MPSRARGYWFCEYCPASFDTSDEADDHELYDCANSTRRLPSRSHHRRRSSPPPNPTMPPQHHQQHPYSLQQQQQQQQQYAQYYQQQQHLHHPPPPYGPGAPTPPPPHPYEWSDPFWSAPPPPERPVSSYDLRPHRRDASWSSVPSSFFLLPDRSDDDEHDDDLDPGAASASAAMLSSRDVAICRGVELLQIRPAGIGGLDDRTGAQPVVGLRCRRCAAASAVARGSAGTTSLSASSSEVTLPRSLGDLPGALRDWGQRHLPICPHVSSTERTLFRRNGGTGREDDFDDNDNDNDNDAPGIRALREFCTRKCRAWGMVNRQPEPSGIVVGFHARAGINRDNETDDNDNENDEGETEGDEEANEGQRLLPESRFQSLSEPRMPPLPMHAAGHHQHPHHHPHYYAHHPSPPLPPSGRGTSPPSDFSAMAAPAAATESFPFVRDGPDGDWICRYCCYVHPQYRDPNHRWTAAAASAHPSSATTPTASLRVRASSSPPPPDFVDHHLHLCRMYHHHLHALHQHQLQQQQSPPPPPPYHHREFGTAAGPSPRMLGDGGGLPQPHREPLGAATPLRPAYSPQRPASASASPPGHPSWEGTAADYYYHHHPTPPSSAPGRMETEALHHRGLPTSPVLQHRPTSTTRPVRPHHHHQYQPSPHPHHPQHGPTLDEAAQRAIEFLTAAEQQRLARHPDTEPPEPPLVRDEDKILLTDFLFHLMRQLGIVRFGETDRKTRGGKREKIRLGFGGLQCRHCQGTTKSRKFFWSGVDRLANSFAEIPAHVFKCTECPVEVKDSLSSLKHAHAEQMARLPRGSQKVFFRRVWKRLHEGDPIADDLTSTEGSPGGGDGPIDRTLSPEEQAAQQQQHSKQQHSPEGTSGSEESIFTLQRPTKDAAKALADAAAQAGPPSPNSRVLLAIAEDRDFLSDVDCLIRRQLEVFCATSEDIRVAHDDRKYPIQEGQIGIRCIHCSLARNGPGASGHAVAYPYSISGIFEAVREFQRLHLDYCENVPPSIRSKISEMKESATITSIQRKYYTLAAKGLGLRDTKEGIRAGSESVPVVSQAVFSFAGTDTSPQAAKPASTGAEYQRPSSPSSWKAGPGSPNPEIFSSDSAPGMGTGRYSTDESRKRRRDDSFGEPFDDPATTPSKKSSRDRDGSDAASI